MASHAPQLGRVIVQANLSTAPTPPGCQATTLITPTRYLPGKSPAVVSSL